MTEDDEFFNDIDSVMHKEYSNFFILVKDSNIKVSSVDIEIDIENKEKYGLNDSISFTLCVKGGKGNIKYFYFGNEISPINYYLRPAEYHGVSTLTILREAIIQETFNPDIMFLERGEKRIN
jgi:hypothetical protein